MRYIGNKVRLLNNIENVIKENKIIGESFCDIFSGTGTVARYFKKDYEVISCDFLYFSYVLQRATVENDSVPTFLKLKQHLNEDVFEYMNKIDEYEFNYSNDKYFLLNNFSSKNGRNYLTDKNAKVLDLWRIKLEEWKQVKLISNDEYFYLLACIIETVPFFSNISGTYGAYLKSWDPRAIKKIKLVELDVNTNNKKNKCYNEDSEKLIKRINGDILYIDPPYNKRQYLPNYHLLETIAKYDYPEIKGVTGIRNYSNQKSRFCKVSEVHTAFEELISSANFNHIILSYSTDGLMTLEEIESIMKKYSFDGSCKIYKIPQTRFKSRKLKNHSELFELIFYIRKFGKRKQKKTQKYLKSPLNYIGGKHKLLKHIIPLFPENISTFVDMFAGGYNVGLNVEANEHVAIDINKYVIEMFNYIKSTDINQLLSDIDREIEKYELSKTNQEGYLRLREDYNDNKNPLQLFLLTCYSFNHQIRYNNSLQFNNPFGKNRSEYNKNIRNNLVKFSAKVKEQNVNFVSTSFEKYDILSLDKDSVVYCDPPYLITTGSYNDGTRGFGDWTTNREEELLSFLDRLDLIGIKFVLSNVLTHKGKLNERLINWSQKYNVIDIDSNYNNSNYQSNAKKHETREVIVRNY